MINLFDARRSSSSIDEEFVVGSAHYYENKLSSFNFQVGTTCVAFDFERFCLLNFGSIWNLNLIQKSSRGGNLNTVESVPQLGIVV